MSKFAKLSLALPLQFLFLLCGDLCVNLSSSAGFVTMHFGLREELVLLRFQFICVQNVQEVLDLSSRQQSQGRLRVLLVSVLLSIDVIDFGSEQA